MLDTKASVPAGAESASAERDFTRQERLTETAETAETAESIRADQWLRR